MIRKIQILLLLGVSTPALAQRTTNNAVTSADDAFGRAIGNERIGIYSNEEVRGFNPQEAGNSRIDGLYFDQASILPQRIVDSSAVRVGYSARGYPFPAPTGIVDYHVEKFAGKKSISAFVEGESHSNYTGGMELKFPIAGEILGFSGGFGFRLADQAYGRKGHFANFGTVITLRPSTETEVTALAGGFKMFEGQLPPQIYLAGNALPPKISRTVKPYPSWVSSRSGGQTYGALGNTKIAGIRLDLGVFKSIRTEPFGYSYLQTGVTPDGRIGNIVVIADAGNSINSNSGEARLSKAWKAGALNHRIMASFRGRAQSRDYAGQANESIGTGLVGQTKVATRPNFRIGDNDHSDVKQTSFGVQYDLQWNDRATFSATVQKSLYKKSTDFAKASLPDVVTRDKPWLFNIGASAKLSQTLTIYGSHVRGLEESANAPEIASNRGEAPPALRTKQSDFGVRYAITPKMAMIAGVFTISKPYFGLDSVQRFRNLGSITNRGVELSLAGSPTPGLTIVAGNLFVDPTIKGPEIDTGRIGARPIGVFRRRSILNLDWMPAGQKTWSFDANIEAVSKIFANRLSTLTAPSRETLAIGARYRFSVGNQKALLRAQITNLLNDYSWRVNSGGGFIPTQQRMLNIGLTVDI